MRRGVAPAFTMPRGTMRRGVAPVFTMPEDVAQHGVGAGGGQGLHEMGDGGYQLGRRGILVN